jgi:hypothetical protein
MLKYGDLYLPSDLGGYIHIVGSSYFKRGAVVQSLSLALLGSSPRLHRWALLKDPLDKASHFIGRSEAQFLAE